MAQISKNTHESENKTNINEPENKTWKRPAEKRREWNLLKTRTTCMHDQPNSATHGVRVCSTTSTVRMKYELP